MEREWDYDFRSQVLTKEELEKLNLIRDGFAKLANHLQNELPDGRYKSIVRTKLEEAAMFATKSFSHK